MPFHKLKSHIIFSEIKCRAKKDFYTHPEKPACMPSSNKLIRVGKSKIHGKGVFAACDIPKGTWIIQYKGEKVSKREGTRRSREHEKQGFVWVFSLNRWYDIDGSVNGNEARFINHSCSPNCEAVNYRDKEIWIVARRDIKKGEELTYDYGFSEDECMCPVCSSKKS
ncbi:SET domain-containing protein [Candidatus Woesearchaeota archaeon]|nr:MAG: SET domain-containing protein [Candidatus Woesearchaeota archaeon]